MSLDIMVLGSESHLDSCIASSEIFPDTYATPYRKDRKLGEGGVFTAVDNNYITTLLMVSDEGASPTPVSPVNDESDSDRTLNELLSSGDSVSLRKNESVNVSSLHWGHASSQQWTTTT
jgi:hypothetical protein